MKCDVCAGACCETFMLPIADILVPTADARGWLILHGVETAPGLLEFACRCRALTPDGRCGIYETRPEVCRLFVPGGPDCLAAVRARRADRFAEIRDPEDPRA